MILAIDVGGTKTLIATFSDSGRVLKKYKFPTPSKKSEFMDKLFKELVPFSKKYRSKIECIVVAIPGLVEHNEAIWLGNRPWKNLDIASKLKSLFDCPVLLENDANLATVYESSFYSGLSLYLTFSTGIGGGLARTGKLAKNSNSVEPGHTKYIFNNQLLEWEDIASCNAIGEHYGKRATSVRGVENFKDISHRLSIGIVELIQKYHPDQIIIGGPLGLRFKHFNRFLKNDLRKRLPASRSLPRLVRANRPKESVIYGEYIYALQHLPANTKCKPMKLKRLKHA